MEQGVEASELIGGDGAHLLLEFSHERRLAYLGWVCHPAGDSPFARVATLDGDHLEGDGRGARWRRLARSALTVARDDRIARVVGAPLAQHATIAHACPPAWVERPPAFVKHPRQLLRLQLVAASRLDDGTLGRHGRIGPAAAPRLAVLLQHHLVRVHGRLVLVPRHHPRDVLVVDLEALRIARIGLRARLDVQIRCRGRSSDLRELHRDCRAAAAWNWELRVNVNAKFSFAGWREHDAGPLGLHSDLLENLPGTVVKKPHTRSPAVAPRFSSLTPLSWRRRRKRTMEWRR